MNEEKGIKIQASTPFETILGPGLQGLLPVNPTGVACSMPPDLLPAASLTRLMTLVKLLSYRCSNFLGSGNIY